MQERGGSAGDVRGKRWRKKGWSDSAVLVRMRVAIADYWLHPWKESISRLSDDDRARYRTWVNIMSVRLVCKVS